MRLSIVMPAYNVAAYIEKTVDRIPAEVWPSLISLWIINDGSRDTTAESINRLKDRYSAIKTVQFPSNRGYGVTVRTGLERCREEQCEVAVCLHADGQYAPELIPIMAKRLLDGGIDILQGSRIASGTALSGGMPLYKFIANRVLTFFENWVLGLHLSDFHSGYLCYSRRALESIDFDRLSNSFDFDIEVIACARAQGLVIGEYPVPTRYAGEKSHVKSIPYGLRCVRIMLRYLAGRYG